MTECYIEDGQTVEKGETLYVIEHEDLDLELSMYETQNTENEQRIEMLDGYLKWLSGESLDLETYADNPFYTEYLARSRLVELNIDSAMQEYDNEQNSYQVKLQTGENVVSYYEEEISKLNQLRDAVKTRSNPFSSEDSYYYAKINDYLTQYQNTVAQYQLSISNLQSELETTFNKIAEAQAAIQEADALLAQTKGGEAEAGANQAVIQEAQAKKDAANSQITTQEAIAQEKQQEIDATLVCAPISGVINLSMDLVENDYLAAGATVMTIIPQDGNGYQVEAYVDNEDIAKIHSGMPVKYEIAAFPSSEYGVMTGEVEFVSADLKAENDTGSAYYMIETTIDDTDMLNQSGEEILLRSGMLCEVKIIVEQKSVLRYFFEKIKLLD